MNNQLTDPLSVPIIRCSCSAYVVVDVSTCVLYQSTDERCLVPPILKQLLPEDEPCNRSLSLEASTIFRRKCYVIAVIHLAVSTERDTGYAPIVGIMMCSIDTDNPRCMAAQQVSGQPIRPTSELAMMV